MDLLANTGKAWRRGQALLGEAFLSFGELATYEADRREGATPSSYMTLFAHLILRGDFDGEPPTLMPFVDLMTIDQDQNYLQIPVFRKPSDRNTSAPTTSLEFLGIFAANAAEVLAQLALLDHWIEGGPERKSDEELQEFSEELLAQEFEAYPDMVQGFLNDTLIAKEKLLEWYRLRGITTPWPDASNDNDKIDKLSDTMIELSNDNDLEEDVKPRLGRPPKPSWPFIERRSRELKRENRKLLNKIIAAQVLGEAADGYKPDELPTESTVIKEMGNILKGI